MTQQQIILVKNTWQVFQKIDPVLVGEVFYEKLFTEHPSFRKLFVSSMQTRAKSLIMMLDMVIKSLDTIDHVKADLKALAARHVQYGVKQEYFEPMGVALLWMLRQGSGNNWNNEVEEAWQACYNTIAGIMMEAYKQQ